MKRIGILVLITLLAITGLALTLRQEYARNYKVGGFLARYADRFPGSGALGEGLRMVKAVSIGLLKRGRLPEWFAFAANCAARMLGNRAGRRRERAHG